MNKQLTNNIKNWKWWVVLPFALILLLVLIIPKCIIFALEAIISAVRLVDFGDMNCKFFKRVFKWVNA